MSDVSGDLHVYVHVHGAVSVNVHGVVSDLPIYFAVIANSHEYSHD